MHYNVYRFVFPLITLSAWMYFG
ncbi:hypothetical protein KIPB_009373, partial [Kipferlia bialata]